jgi:hypothetical protein
MSFIPSVVIKSPLLKMPLPKLRPVVLFQKNVHILWSEHSIEHEKDILIDYSVHITCTDVFGTLRH